MKIFCVVRFFTHLNTVVADQFGISLCAWAKSCFVVITRRSVNSQWFLSLGWNDVFHVELRIFSPFPIKKLNRFLFKYIVVLYSELFLTFNSESYLSLILRILKGRLVWNFFHLMKDRSVENYFHIGFRIFGPWFRNIFTAGKLTEVSI